jgi:predicted MPP superfamily phosphohydrolase
MSWFIITALAVNLIIIVYVASRIASYFQVNRLIPLLLSFAIVIIFFFSRTAAFSAMGGLGKLSSYAYGLLICALFCALLVDILRLFRRLFIKRPESQRLIRGGYLALLVMLFSVGVYMQAVPRTVYYSVSIDKPANIEKLRIVHLSDIHLSEQTDADYIKNMVQRVNALNPDVIVITGDTLDNRLQPYLDQDLAQYFAQLKAPYGTLLIYGNHEYYGIARNEDNRQEDVAAAFGQGNMTVLQDQRYPLADSGIIVVGRDDYAGSLSGNTRLPLETLLADIDISNTPVILLDHQPYNLDNAADNGIDLMLSGHTHAGQIFPITLVVKHIYQNPWGIYQLHKDNGQTFTSIVSSGYGIWGPYIRLLTRSEIVVVDLEFKRPN